MEFEDGKRAIAQIYSETNQVAGTGFLVADRYVVTCAHVVRLCCIPTPFPNADLKGRTLVVRFPFATADRPYRAQVIFYALDQGSKDMAVLDLVEVPNSLTAAPLRAALLSDEDRDLKTYGFPIEAAEFGQPRNVTSQGGIANGWIKIVCSQTGGEIEPGYSGAPVWCPTQKGVVGMIVARDAYRQGDRIAFMIPMQRLGEVLDFIQQHSLLELLASEQQNLEEQIAIAYETCRPTGSIKPYQHQLKQRLAELLTIPTGEENEPMLVQFVACLLNQKVSEQIQQELLQWAKFWTTKPEDLDGLCGRLQRKYVSKQVEIGSPEITGQPYLIVSIKEDAGKSKPYSVQAWWVRDVNCYNPQSGTGAEPLVFQACDGYPEAQDLNPEEGIAKDKIAVLLADYLDQIGTRIDIHRLIIELWLPMSLMNEPFDQQPIPSPDGFFPIVLAQDCHVIVGLQDRLAVTRMRGRWETKWQRLQALLEKNAGFYFESGIDNIDQLRKNLRPDDVLGLRLVRKPRLDKLGELGALIATGTPAAIWPRQTCTGADWEGCLAQQVFCCMQSGTSPGAGETVIEQCCLSAGVEARSRASCQSISLAELADRIKTIRQNAPHLEEEDDLEQSREFGHHLAFLWENPNRVPPDSPYSHDSL